MSFESKNIEDYIRLYKKGSTNTNDVRDLKQNKLHISEKNESENVEFQIIDIDFYNREDEDEKKFYTMMIFGKTRDDRSVCVNVEGFTPYFYVEIDSRWTSMEIRRIIKDIQDKVYPKEFKDGMLSYKIIKAHKFYGFTNKEKFKFLHIIFNDYDSMKAYERAFAKKHTMMYISKHRKVSFNLYESNIHPILRFLHIQKLDPIGWCKIEKKNFKEFEYNHKKGTTDININCNWQNIERVESNDIHKMKILAFDIECDSVDGKFPQYDRDGDRIIQIGMTYSYLGDTECFKKVILCLNKTNDISGAEVKCFDDEKDLLLAFTDQIRSDDPDIITGYNIFGFDFNYMMHRAKKFNIYSKFSRLSRIKGHVCKFNDQKLESSALGRNFLKYYQTPGRICIDLMKVIQRDYKLGSYSLDAVASVFIRDKIIGYEYVRENDIRLNSMNFETNHDVDNHDVDNHDVDNHDVDNHDVNDDIYSSDDEEKNDDDDICVKKNINMANKKKILYTILKVKSTTGVNEGDYIAIYYNNGPVDNRIGKKYKILKIDNNTILVRNKIRLRQYLSKWKVFWCQAKDDVGPKQIFMLFRGTAENRRTVAKYCLKDCSLCNRLIAKLQILPNSIGMGNVCCVPMSYLFLRGQSIKIFSLISKQCREENYLIPVLAKKYKKNNDKNKKSDDHNKKSDDYNENHEKRFQRFVRNLIKEEDEDSDDDMGYEGATVFDPITGVHYEPVIVDDYGSLYPSSMIMKNLSHNSIVLDPKYENIDGYKYHTQSYVNNDGTKSTYKFAENINGEKATIPRILQKLLTARKICKQKHAIETDPFKKSIWDGLQLAYKVTANSLYGQCGTHFSPICMKQIAACTTAIGRDMLELAKNYVENEMTEIIKLINISYDSNDSTNYLEFMRNYYKNVPDERVKCGKESKDKNGEIIMNWKYQNKEEYFQWVRNEIYTLLKPYNVDPKCIYGDTDSVFFKLNMTYKETGEKFNNHDALKISIKIGILTSGIVNYTLEYPQVLEYEKVYWPFAIISKKRYVGNLYEFDPDSYYQKSMGLVTKRRDNADIVKVVVGGIIDQILNQRSAIGAVDFTKSQLMKIITGKYNIDKFIITKTVRDKESYANWHQIVHMVLADRMVKRDPGNAPQSNDRIPYVYIEVNKKVKLQGERAEHPKYIKENNLKIDYLFYITNQIMKPALQFLELIVKNPTAIFNKYIIREENRKSGISPIMKHLNCVSGQGNVISVAINGVSGDSLFGRKPDSCTNRKTRNRVRREIKKK